jgi:hypothetical protein
VGLFKYFSKEARESREKAFLENWRAKRYAQRSKYINDLVKDPDLPIRYYFGKAAELSSSHCAIPSDSSLPFMPDWGDLWGYVYALGFQIVGYLYLAEEVKWKVSGELSCAPYGEFVSTWRQSSRKASILVHKCLSLLRRFPETDADRVKRLSTAIRNMEREAKRLQCYEPEDWDSIPHVDIHSSLAMPPQTSFVNQAAQQAPHFKGMFVLGQGLWPPENIGCSTSVPVKDSAIARHLANPEIGMWLTEDVPYSSVPPALSHNAPCSNCPVMYVDTQDGIHLPVSLHVKISADFLPSAHLGNPGLLSQRKTCISGKLPANETDCARMRVFVSQGDDLKYILGVLRPESGANGQCKVELKVAIDDAGVAKMLLLDLSTGSTFDLVHLV